MNHLKGYPDLDAAMRSKAAGLPGAVIDDQCPCKLVHVRQAKTPRVATEVPRQRDTGPTRKVRSLVLDRDDHSCVSCGAVLVGRPYSLQHRVARGMGGSRQPWINSPVNLLVLCGTATTPGGCHLLCEQRDPGMHDRGLWLTTDQDPAEVPVYVRSEWGYERYWLTADGGLSRTSPKGLAA